MANIQDKSTIHKKQIVKFVSNEVKFNLLDANEKHPLNKSFRTSLICNNVLKADPEKTKLTSLYCKQRWCLTCNRIRTAIFIDEFTEPIMSMNEPRFVTLTRQSVKDEVLPRQMRTMYDIWRAIAKKAKKAKFKREIGEFKGIRKAECTLRPKGKSHFHFHIIVDGQQQAEWLLSEWLKRNGQYSSEFAQDISSVNENMVIEMGKYFSKLSIKGQDFTDYKRLATLFYQMKGKRVFQTFGNFKRLVIDEEDFDEKLTAEKLDRIFFDDYFNWSKDFRDWIGNETGEFLSGEKVPEELLQKWNLMEQKQGIKLKQIENDITEKNHSKK